MAGSADTLQVFPPVWIPCPQPPDQPCRHDVIHMPPRPILLEVMAAHSTSHFCPNAETRWLRQPFRVGAIPGHLRSTPSHRTAFSCVRNRALQNWRRRYRYVLASAKDGLENIRSPIATIWTMHRSSPPFCCSSWTRKVLVQNSGLERIPFVQHFASSGE